MSDIGAALKKRRTARPGFTRRDGPVDLNAVFGVFRDAEQVPGSISVDAKNIAELWECFEHVTRYNAPYPSRIAADPTGLYEVRVKRAHVLALVRLVTTLTVSSSTNAEHIRLFRRDGKATVRRLFGDVPGIAQRASTVRDCRDLRSTAMTVKLDLEVTERTDARIFLSLINERDEFEVVVSATARALAATTASGGGGGSSNTLPLAVYDGTRRIDVGRDLRVRPNVRAEWDALYFETPRPRSLAWPRCVIVYDAARLDDRDFDPVDSASVRLRFDATLIDDAFLAHPVVRRIYNQYIALYTDTM